MAEFEWYDYRAIFSRNALISLVVGARSIGKTYGAKRDAVKLYLATGGESLWIRRTLTELRPAKAGFFDGIRHEWPGFDFRVEGDEGQIKTDGETWQTVIRFAALSIAAQMRGTEFPNVRRMYYDECMIDPDTNARYLEAEPDRLMNLWVTVNRSRVDKSGRAEVRLVLLGNVYDLDNPWFLRWDFTAAKEWQKALGGEVVLHLVDAKRYEIRVSEGVYGKALGVVALGYGQGDYFRPDGGYIIPARPGDSRPFATLVTSRGTFGVWVGQDYQTMYVTVGALPTTDARTVTFEPLEVRPGVPLAANTEFVRKDIKRHYKRGSLFFVTPGAMAARPILAR